MKVETTAKVVYIEIDEWEVDDRTGMAGYDVAQVDIKHNDGRTSRFFLNIRMKNDNKAVAEIATIKNDGSTSTRHLVGVKKTFSHS